MAMTAREAAWTALQRWRKNGAWSDAALNAVLQSAQLEPRDAALAARICYGTLQNLTLLDHYLSVYCTTPLQKLEPKVLDLLRLSAYQIVLLDKIPPRAAVNEAVVLCRKGGCARASGLVNAVLRRVAEHRDALPEIPYVFGGYTRLLDDKGYPGITPPWGTLTAIDVARGAIRWQVTLGDRPEARGPKDPPTPRTNSSA